ncbi:hypothetical protein CFBP6109_03761 [Pseudomonas syringae pv. cerasicola]|nr:hypothetical protein CFBP6109_03761 [Pseudomonas syringae pv. cerasicola]
MFEHQGVDHGVFQRASLLGIELLHRGVGIAQCVAITETVVNPQVFQVEALQVLRATRTYQPLANLVQACDTIDELSLAVLVRHLHGQQ